VPVEELSNLSSATSNRPPASLSFIDGSPKEVLGDEQADRKLTKAA
jgi:hypothetical protein